MFEKQIERLCEWIAEGKPHKIIPRPDGGPYLLRVFLLGGSRKKETPEISDHPYKPRWASWLGVNVFLHCFYSSDIEKELHSHPWRDSCSIILTTGYREERLVDGKVVTRIKRQFSINRIRSTDYHRVELLGDRCWTLFFAGRNTDTWYFWDRKTGEKIPWREQIFVRNPRKQTLQA